MARQTTGTRPTNTSPQEASQANEKRATKRPRRRATATQHSDLGEKLIAGVPARIMRPRLVFIFCLIAICSFGLLMVYSASAVEALQEEGSSTHFLFAQARFMALGAVVVVLLTGRAIPGFPPWGAVWSLAWAAWLVIIALLAITLVIGQGGEDWGAKRWIYLGGFSLQASEFAKPVIVMVASRLFSQYYEENSIDTWTFLGLMAACVGLPSILIFFQPDMGTTVIIIAAIVAMCIIVGFSPKLLLGGLAVMVVVGLFFVLSSTYRRERLFTMMDPWSDPWGDGYQATLAIMAFASGGLFGRGIGNSTMKYNYLPEAHNDYILAIIGEEMGFVGTAIFVIIFLLMLYAAFLIARRAPTLHAQLLAAGCTMMFAIQFFVNVFGILGLMPMTGKPLPFVSYGGSSVLASMIMAGIILRVSIESNQETAADRRRAGMSVMREDVGEDVSSHLGRSTAGVVRSRSGRRADAVEPRGSSRSSSGLSVYDGGRAPRATYDEPRSSRGGRRSGSASGQPYERVNLQGDGSDRLRTSGVRTRVDYRGITGNDRPRRSGDSRRGPSNSSRRDRYDR